MSRTAEFVLGLIGAIFGFIGAIIVIFLGGIDTALTGSTTIVFSAWLALFMSIVGLVGAIMVRSKAKMGGILMIISAIAGIICIFVFYLVPGILLLIGGLMGFFRNEKVTVRGEKG